MRWRRTAFEQLDSTIWRPADDAVLLDDGDRVCARVYRAGGGMSGRWFWAWQRRPCETGYVDTKEAAKAECERRAVEQLQCSPIRAD